MKKLKAIWSVFVAVMLAVLVFTFTGIVGFVVLGAAAALIALIIPFLAIGKGGEAAVEYLGLKGNM